MNSNGAVATNIAIKHPNIFYFVLDASWSSNNSLEFWNKGNTATILNNNTIYKTIYSPSPSDYVEPRSKAFTGFTITGGNSTTLSQYNVSGTFNKGWNFYCQPNATGSTVFFSALGYRDVYSGRVNTSSGGAVADISRSGGYWSAGPADTPTTGRNVTFGPGWVHPVHIDVRAIAFVLRPVSE